MDFICCRDIKNIVWLLSGPVTLSCYRGWTRESSILMYKVCISSSCGDCTCWIKILYMYIGVCLVELCIEIQHEVVLPVLQMVRIKKATE